MPAPKFDLKLRLALRVAALAAVCFAAAAAYVLFDTDRAARARAETIADAVAGDLSLQQGVAHWVQINRAEAGSDPFPDLQRIATAVMAPGLCIAFRAENGGIVQRLCSGAAPGDAGAPLLFAALYQGLFGAGREAARPVMYGGAAHGEAVVSIDRQSLIGQSWRETSRLLAIMAATLVGLCVLVYAALADALRPTRAIREGLARLVGGDLSARLPPFDLAELSAVGAVFNDLAGNLETTLAERNALTRRLIAVQDEERLHLARELHDEFGQCLAAIGAMAASAGQTARRDCPALEPPCQSIGRTAAHMMQALRGALLRLRPPDVEELGLAASLEGLVAGWNGRGGATRFSIELRGDFDALPRDFAASLYRVAQEAITNAAKHAEAAKVTLRLSLREPQGSDRRAHIELAVDDDGKGGADAKSGMGLLGMRERVEALGGRLSLKTSRPSGLALRAHIPVPPAAAPDETLAAA
ncbi:integral membrane sensor signal transduction histidine kinase [Methylocella silvestris BL2]|uniref:Integral membrane sensor signal transduction histidine kinase n=1 Tax=Methylocella silvestris (strain DSM 15510 / CIP 108128 / LMG 27833 / NCIMB 13906 / BL2) TaxID=395965 RepID=B8ET68_METSB|nr:histidine kinase [Methylocella silvestris]ACK51206.1 integral membrane sensor signal transduction histidine kinase [Methylocella silvestris BL2]